MLSAAVSVQCGAALATVLFDRAGILGTVLLRLGFATLVLLALSRRSAGAWRGRPLRWVVVLGVTLAFMNSLFYASLDRIPLGTAVTVEFLGPLAVAVAGSRRPRDLVWIVLAGAGVALFGSPTLDVDPVGLAFALGAGGLWAVYIVSGQRVAETWPLTRGLALATALATVLLAPVAGATAGPDFLEPSVLALGLGIAILSSAVPWSLELAALRRVRASTFGILLSLEPAVAALVGAVLLAQTPDALEALAIALVVVASIGATASARPTLPPQA